MILQILNHLGSFNYVILNGLPGIRLALDGFEGATRAFCWGNALVAGKKYSDKSIMRGIRSCRGRGAATVSILHANTLKG